MATIPDTYPYQHARIAELTATQRAELLRADADFTSPALTASSGVVSGVGRSGALQSVTTSDIVDALKYATLTTAYAELDRTTIASRATAMGQGRPTYTLEMEVYLAEDPNALSTKDLLINDTAGERFIYVQRQNGDEFCGVFVITNVAEQGTDTNGDMTYRITLMNASHSILSWG